MSHPDQDNRMPRRRATPPSRRGRLRRAVGGGLAAAVLAVVSAGCSGGSSSGLGSPDQPLLRVGLVQDVGAVPFEIATSAAEHGFSSAGITVNTQLFNTDADEIAALKAGTIDIAYGSYASFLSSNSSLATSGDLRVLADAYDAGPGTVGLVVRQGALPPSASRIQSGASNAKIAVPGGTEGDSVEFLALSSWLESSGYPIGIPGDLGDADIKFVASPAAAIAAVASGTVDAAALQEPYVTSSEEQQGLRLAVDLASGSTASMPLDGYFTTSTFAAKYPRSSAIFAATISKYQEMASSQVAVETALKNQPGADTDVISTMQFGTYPLVLLDAKLDITIGLMNTAGIAANNVTSLKLTSLDG
jgi:NitT/TauT family transport system substrate-binding protein